MEKQSVGTEHGQASDLTWSSVLGNRRFGLTLPTLIISPALANVSMYCTYSCPPCAMNVRQWAGTLPLGHLATGSSKMMP